MSKLHSTEPGPGSGARSASVAPRIIEVGEIAAGITVPEGRGVRFFSSTRDFDSLDGVVFGSTEQAARAARDRFRARTRPGGRVARASGQRLRAV